MLNTENILSCLYTTFFIQPFTMFTGNIVLQKDHQAQAFLAEVAVILLCYLQRPALHGRPEELFFALFFPPVVWLRLSFPLPGPRCPYLSPQPGERQNV